MDQRHAPPPPLDYAASAERRLPESVWRLSLLALVAVLLVVIAAVGWAWTQLFVLVSHGWP